jgi:hypothetical protein
VMAGQNARDVSKTGQSAYMSNLAEDGKVLEGQHATVLPVLMICRQRVSVIPERPHESFSWTAESHQASPHLQLNFQ